MLGCFPPLLLCVIIWGTILAGWAYQKPLGSACFHPLSHIAGVTYWQALPCTAFYLGARDLNWSFHAGTLSRLPAESSLQPEYLLLETVSCSLYWPATCCRAEDDFEALPLPPSC